MGTGAHVVLPLCVRFRCRRIINAAYQCPERDRENYHNPAFYDSLDGAAIAARADSDPANWLRRICLCGGDHGGDGNRRRMGSPTLHLLLALEKRSSFPHRRCCYDRFFHYDSRHAHRRMDRALLLSYIRRGTLCGERVFSLPCKIKRRNTIYSCSDEKLTMK